MLYTCTAHIVVDPVIPLNTAIPFSSVTIEAYSVIPPPSSPSSYAGPPGPFALPPGTAAGPPGPLPPGPSAGPPDDKVLNTTNWLGIPLSTVKSNKNDISSSDVVVPPPLLTPLILNLPFPDGGGVTKSKPSKFQPLAINAS